MPVRCLSEWKERDVNRSRGRSRLFKVLVAITVGTSLVIPPVASAAAKGEPASLSAAELTALLNSMGPAERMGRQSTFRNSRYGIVAYTRAFVALSDDGAPLSSEAGSAVEPLGSGSKSGLYVSVSVARDYDAPYRANYGWLTSTIKETRFQNYYTSVVAKYFHTYSGVTYSLSFSTSPGISISPTSSQWSLAEYAGFTV